MAYADTWSNDNDSGLYSWKDIACSADGMKAIAVVGDNSAGYFYITDDGGWTWAQSGTSARWFAADCSSDFSTIIVSPLGTYASANLQLSTDSGASWSATGGSKAWMGVCGSSDGTIWYAAVNAGKVWKSVDSGTTFSELASSPARFAWARLACSADGSIILGTGNGSGQETYLSTNSGTSWAQTGTVKYGVDVCMSDNGTYQFIASRNGYVYVSNNSGATWSQVLSGSIGWRSVSCSSTGQYVLATYNTSTAYASIDYGVTWSAITIDGASTAIVTASAASASGMRLYAGAEAKRIYINETLPDNTAAVVRMNLEVLSPGEETRRRPKFFTYLID